MSEPNTEFQAITPVSTVTVVRWTAQQVEEQTDPIAIEEPVEIQIVHGPVGQRQRRVLSITMRTPGHDDDLAIGFLAGETILQRPTDYREVRLGRGRVSIELEPELNLDLERLNRHFYTTSSCGVCGKTSLDAVEAVCVGPSPGGIHLAPVAIHRLSEQLRSAQPAFASTGGLHAAALFDETGQLLAVREDVGRHNAVDKLLGAEFRAGRWPLANRILMVSGRASFELVQKAAVAGVPVFAAVGAPSSLAIQLARRFRLTLLGFVRDDRFNLYSGRERIADDRA